MESARRRITLGQVGIALAPVTVIPLLLAIWSFRRPDSDLPLWLLLLVQATVLLNVFGHIGTAAIVFDGYAPGLVTAVLINLPFSISLLSRASRERWVSRRALRGLVPGALLMHGPLLSALLLGTERLER